MLLSKSLNQAAEKATSEDANEDGQRLSAAANYQHVDINSVQTSESKSIGAEHVMAEQMNQYGFDGNHSGIEQQSFSLLLRGLNCLEELEDIHRFLFSTRYVGFVP